MYVSTIVDKTGSEKNVVDRKIHNLTSQLEGETPQKNALAF
ncbi:MAG: hypothetical protein ABIF85_05300 [Nanoarchaeota archaeon]